MYCITHCAPAEILRRRRIERHDVTRHVIHKPIKALAVLESFEGELLVDVAVVDAL